MGEYDDDDDDDDVLRSVIGTPTHKFSLCAGSPGEQCGSKNSTV